jgi:hypothetical protein
MPRIAGAAIPNASHPVVFRGINGLAVFLWTERE